MLVEDREARLFAEERRRQILLALAREGSVYVTRLSRALKCAQATLRRDLRVMEDAGLLVRTHGGAVPVGPEPASRERSVTNRASLHVEEKQAIGLTAARLVAPGDTLAFNGGTTTVQVARALAALAPARPVRVVTNSIGIALELADHPSFEVTLTGGQVRGSLELSGPLAEQALRDLHVRTAFIGVDGLTARHGLTTYDQVEALTNRAIMAHAARVVVVADHTKIGQVTMALIAPCRAIHTLVTDSAASGDEINALRALGIEVVTAG